ncbi:MAG: RNA polymerase sigma factor, partial [Pirellula sp.]
MSSIQTPNSPSTSISLLQRASGGESNAWQRVVQIYGPLVYSWARRTGLQPQEAADVTQETFLAVYKRLPSFRSDRPGSTFRGWLRTITQNKAADLIRERIREPKVHDGTANLIALESLCARSEPLNQDSSSLSESCHDEESDKRVVLRRILAILRGNFEKNTWQA